MAAGGYIVSPGCQQVDTLAPMLEHGPSGSGEENDYYAPQPISAHPAQVSPRSFQWLDQVSPRSNLMELHAALGLGTVALDDACTQSEEPKRRSQTFDRLHSEVSSIRCEAVEWQRAQRQQEVDLRCRLEQAEAEREEYRMKLLQTQQHLAEIEGHRGHVEKVENGSDMDKLQRHTQEQAQQIQALQQQLDQARQQLRQAQASMRLNEAE